MKTSLGLLREHVRHLLIIEGRFEDVSKKYPTVDINFLSQNDPSKQNKYLSWMAKQVSSGSDPQQVVDIVQQFKTSFVEEQRHKFF